MNRVIKIGLNVEKVWNAEMLCIEVHLNMRQLQKAFNWKIRLFYFDISGAA